MAALETTATRRKIVKELQKNKIGFTAREISETLKIKVQTISATLQQMALSGFVQRGELIEGEGQIWEVTALGIAEYGIKSDLEIKNNTQESESALEQLVNDELGKLADIKYADDSIARGMCSVKSVDVELTGLQCDPAKYAEKFGNQVDSEVEAIESELTGPELAEKRFNEMEIGTFEVFQLTNNLASSFIKLMQSKQSKVIENIDYKIQTLHCLADILNSKHSDTLREIAADLRG